MKSLNCSVSFKAESSEIWLIFLAHIKSEIKTGESLELNVWDERKPKTIGKLFKKDDRFLGSARITPKIVEKFINAGGNFFLYVMS